MKKEEGVEGHMVLRDDIIHSIVRGKLPKHRLDCY